MTLLPNLGRALRSPARIALAAVMVTNVAGASLLLAEIGAPPPALAQAAQAVTVKIDNFTFNPGTITVKAGTTVTWVNADDIPHSVRAVDGGFKSKVLDSDEKFSFTFAKAGEYAYFCSLHPHMTGKVVVKP